MGVPLRKGRYLYYSRTEQGKQYPIYCRKNGTLDAAEEITLDLNALAEGKAFMALGAYTVSDDGRLLAYSTDDTGFRQYTLHVKDLVAGETLPLRCRRRTGSVAWAADNGRSSTASRTSRPSATTGSTAIASGPRPRDLVYEEDDEAFNLGVGRTRSRAYLVLGIGSHTTSEARVLPADDPGGEWTPRRPAHRRAGVRGRSPRRPVLHPDERHGPQLPPGVGAGGPARDARRWTGGAAPPPRRDARGHRRLPGPPRRLASARTGCPTRGSPTCARGQVPPDRVSGARLRRVPGRERRVRHEPSTATPTSP